MSLKPLKLHPRRQDLTLRIIAQNYVFMLNHQLKNEKKHDSVGRILGPIDFAGPQLHNEKELERETFRIY